MGSWLFPPLGLPLASATFSKTACLLPPRCQCREEEHRDNGGLRLEPEPLRGQ